MAKIKLPAEPEPYEVKIELIPETSWYFNLRKVLPKAEWDKLRKQAYADYGYRCAGCKKSGVQLHAHEVWKFRSRGKKQILVRLVCLCGLCHGVEHFGRTEMQGGEFARKVVRHALDDLRWTFEQLRDRRDRAFGLWQRRSMYSWKVDFGPYKHLVPKEVKNETKTQT